MRRPGRQAADLWVSASVREKLAAKHQLEVWEVEQALFDDPDRLLIRAGELFVVYGRTFAGRYILCLIRRLTAEEIAKAQAEPSVTILRLVTAREMNETQRRRYQARRGRR